MYDELIKAFREWPRVCQQYEDSIDQLHDQAADAIEELVKALERSKEWEKFWEKEANEALKKFQTTVASMPRWIPVTERLPEDGSDILAVQRCCGEVRIIPANYDRDVWYDCIFDRVAEHITHWMPLPQPPKEGT